MGMLIYDALVIARAVQECDATESCLTLGVPTMGFTSEIFHAHAERYTELARNTRPRSFETAPQFFETLGFPSASMLDVSDYEGADITADLNDPNMADKVSGQFDLIYDSGTLEHVFDMPTALRNLTKLTRIGGVVIHATPSNGFLDHGFWQVSPDLYKSYYTQAGFEVLTAALFVLSRPPYAMSAADNMYRAHGRKYVVEMASEAILVFAAKKRREVASVDIKLQDYYENMHGGAASEMAVNFFLPFGEVPQYSDLNPQIRQRQEPGILNRLKSVVMRR